MILLMISYLLIAIFIWRGCEINLRETIIRAYLAVFGITLLITEFLSLFNLVTYKGILVAWSVVIVLSFAGIILINKNSRLIKKEKFQKLLKNTGSFSWLELIIIFVIALILIITLIIALYAPPNNFDSMSYHMARVVQWIQQKNINFYTTSIPRQNHSMPMAEYMILHVQLLSGSDQYANLIQWSGFCVLLIAVSEIARLFKVSRTGQFFSALIAVTMPMAILQSSSTQNDIITSVFCILFAYFLVKMIKSGSWIDAFFGGLAFGLALLTKGTAYIYCAAIGSTLSIGGMVYQFKNGKMKLILMLSAMLLGAFILNIGMFSRNIDLYSNPLSTETNRITVDKITVEGLYSNLLRNGSAHLAVPFPSINDVLSNTLKSHLGERVSDQQTTFSDTEFQIKYLINEDESGNFFHFILLTITFLLLPKLINKKDILLAAYASSVLLSIILFSALLKWQPWGVRLQLPIFFLGIPIIIYVFERMRISKTLTLIMVLCLSFYSLPYLFLNSTRPLVPLFRDNSAFKTNQVKKFFSDRPNLYTEYREIIAPFYKDISVLHTDRQEMYFSSNVGMYQDYLTVMNAVNELDEEYLGLHLGSNDWEYPIWVMADRLGSEGYPKFIHFDVENESKKLETYLDILPRYVISAGNSLSVGLSHNNYSKIIDTPTIDLLIR